LNLIIRGSVGVSFRNADGLFEMQVDVPVNTKAMVYIPLGGVRDAVVKKDGTATDVRPEDGYAVLGEVGSGRHVFERVSGSADN
jgi:hypothetical protein